MNKYKKLIHNSGLFFIANFGSKVLTFLLVRFYTEVLTKTEYGVADLLNTTSALAYPLVTLCITEAVLRFSIDEASNRAKILSNGLMVTILGNIGFLLFFPVFYSLELFRDNIVLLYLLTLTNSLTPLMAHFARGIGNVKLFAASGILQTFCQIGFNLLLLLVVSWGVKGYILSSIFANLCTMTAVFFVGRLYRYIDIRIDCAYLKRMLIYAMPLIPNSIFWWIMQSSNRYVITYMLSSADNGLYAIANKFPTILATVSAVFFQAWQLSSVEEAGAKDKNHFYSSVFKMFSMVLIISTSFILIFLQPLYSILVERSYYSGWRCAPFLMCAMIFSCFSTFLGTNYVVMKKTNGVFLTTVFGAVINIVLNLCLTPLWGIYGTALSTVAAFGITWIARAVDTRKFVKIEYPLKNFILPLVLVFIQAVFLTLNIKSLWLQTLFCVGIILCYFRDILMVGQKGYEYGKLYIERRKK